MQTALLPSVTTPIEALTSACRRMETLAERSVADAANLFHVTVSAIHAICEALIRCEDAGVEPEELRSRLGRVRKIHALSPFIRRLQDWPREYAGDFETIEWLWRGENRAEGTLARALEHYALTSAIAQQHRNKIAFQASCLLEAERLHSCCRVLSLACGSSPDLRSIVEQVKPSTTFVLCDSDAEALEFSRSTLLSIAQQCVLVNGRVPLVLRTLRRHGPFHLIVAGGLFDYLPDRVVERTLALAADILLAPGGRVVFTNLAQGNPFRVWLEYVADWPLLERSEADVVQLARNAGLASFMTLKRDATGLAILASIAPE